MHSKKTQRKKLVLICKGIAMGVANKIPGVSGGIVALAAGFYKELIYSFSKFDKTALTLLFKKEFKAFYTYVNGPFLSLLFTGVVISFFSASLILDQFIKYYPRQVWGLFFGMILASVFFIWIKAKRYTYKEYIATILGLTSGLLVTFLIPGQENDNLLFVFICGIISISGMILPGLSGSFLILVLGNYTLLLIDSVNALYFTLVDLVSFDLKFLEDPARLNLLGVMLTFTLGSICGLLVLSKALRWFLQHYPEKIIALLIGFILGSLNATWPWKRAVYNPVKGTQIDSHELFWPKLTELENIYVILFILLGIGIITLLETYGKKVHNNKRYGLVGKDIAYSFSRSYFADKFQKEDIDNCSYENFDLETIEEIKTVLKAQNLGGLNVTIPYKEAILPYIDHLSEDAKIIGAVNTVRVLVDGTTEGHNTDAYGFKAALLRQWNNHADKALILGTGGASKAVHYVLQQMNIEPLFVSRNPKAGQITYEQIDAALMRTHKLIINCTPIGTYPDIDQAPQIPYDLIDSGHFLFDLIYNPEVTHFLAEGKKKGATIQNGHFMLEQQAEKSWNIWNEFRV